MSDSQREYRENDELIDQVCDWIAQKWTTSMVVFQLRKILDKDIKRTTVVNLIKSAKARIVERYNIPVEEYKGDVIAWWEFVMRGKSFSKDGAPAKMCDRIRAVENLTSLLNLENISGDGTADSARRWREFIKQGDETIPSEPSADKESDKEPNTDNKPSTNEEQGDGKETGSKESGQESRQEDDKEKGS